MITLNKNKLKPTIGLKSDFERSVTDFQMNDRVRNQIWDQMESQLMDQIWSQPVGQIYDNFIQK